MILFPSPGGIWYHIYLTVPMENVYLGKSRVLRLSALTDSSVLTADL